nr:probable RNA-dependent RNA polymerase 3 isoform X1 [Ipomoea batatas]GME16056.1 probable RNA-dependent RNA polymerase 3 isoform X1 [Ipomoea batatas]
MEGAEEAAALPQSVEELLQKICAEQSQEAPDVEVRRRLGAIGEEGANRILKKIASRPIKTTLNAFIIYMLNKYPKCVSSEDHRSPFSTPHKTHFTKSSPHKPTGLLRFYPPLQDTRRMLFPIDELESQLAKKIGGCSSSQVSLPIATHTATTSSTIRGTCSMQQLPRLLPPPQEKITITAQKRSGSSSSSLQEKLKEPEVKKLKLGMDIDRNASIACGHIDVLELVEKMAPPADLERLEGQETQELFKSSIHKSMEAIFHMVELQKRMGVCMSELKTYQEEKESLKKELSDEVEKVRLLSYQIDTAQAKITSLTNNCKEVTTTMNELLCDEVEAAYLKGKAKMQQEIYQVLRDRFPDDFNICSWNLPVELQLPSSSSNNTMIPPLVMLDEDDTELLEAGF